MKIEIIAECAQGYVGDPSLALQLLKASSASGADAAKFQLVYADELCTPDYKDYSISKQLEMPEKVWEDIAYQSKNLNIELILDVFGERSLKLAEKLKSRTVMLHATDITNLNLIAKVESGPISRVILGAGGAHLPEITAAIEALPTKDICVMLGYQGYPTPDVDNQISRISYLLNGDLKKYNNVVVGFSDHSLPDSNLRLALSTMALGAGAVMFEKHLTLAHVLKMEDYESAINPDLFAEYVEKLRICNDAHGDVSSEVDFGMSDSEKGYRKFVRRNVIAARRINAGDKVNVSDFIFKRSSISGAITNVDDVVGKLAVKDLQQNQPVKMSDFK